MFKYREGSAIYGSKNSGVLAPRVSKQMVLQINQKLYHIAKS